jgi:hypothetical protein
MGGGAALAQTDLAAGTLPDAPAPQQTSSSSAGDSQTPQQTPASQPAATQPSQQTQPTAPPKTETSAEVLKREEKQRILGVVPNFNMVESADNVPPLTPGQKFHLMYKSSVDPFVFVTDAFVAGIGQARDTNDGTTVTVNPDGTTTTTRWGFGQGAQGYFKRFGASYADTVDGNLWGNAILPILFKEDPRYFRMGTGTFTHRFLYSASTTVWCRRDSGTWGPNYANVLGNFVSGGISNLYYPSQSGGFGQTMYGAATVTAEGTIGAEFVEFWPDISRRLFKKHHQSDPAPAP